MEKRNYMTPAIEVHEVQFQQMVATSIGLDNTNTYSGKGKNFAPGFRNPFAMPGNPFSNPFSNPFED